ncbi:hypothetical protein AMECASPLE_024789 [Ameca splendens]|uniref:Uncharacterized protein n=1 Tax=Ameca splendens TaxID=208324 RepID=A0ABV0Y4F8_9TELE
MQHLQPMCLSVVALDVSSHSPLLVKPPHILERILLDNPLKATVTLVAPFPTTLFPSTQFSNDMLEYSTLRATSFHQLLDNLQVSSLLINCVSHNTEFMGKYIYFFINPM